MTNLEVAALILRGIAALIMAVVAAVLACQVIVWGFKNGGRR